MFVRLAIRRLSGFAVATVLLTLCVARAQTQELAVLQPSLELTPPAALDPRQPDPAPAPDPPAPVADEADLGPWASPYDRVWMEAALRERPLLDSLPTHYDTPLLDLRDESITARFQRALGVLPADPRMFDHPLYRDELNEEVEDRVNDAISDVGDSLSAALFGEYDWLDSARDAAVIDDREADRPIRAHLAGQQTAGKTTGATATATATDRALDDADSIGRRIFGDSIGYTLEPDLRGLDLGYRLRLKNRNPDTSRIFDSSQLGIYTDGEIRASINRTLGTAGLSLGAHFDLADGDQKIQLSWGISW